MRVAWGCVSAQGLDHDRRTGPAVQFNEVNVLKGFDAADGGQCSLSIHIFEDRAQKCGGRRVEHQMPPTRESRILAEFSRFWIQAC